jgi:beta-glucosidase
MSLMDRRALLASAGAVIGAVLLRPADAGTPQPAPFPKDFLWGVATAGHQIEGNNVASDIWLVENVKPTVFAEPSGDACNSLELWPQDIELVKNLSLNTYRFSLEWARIEPEPGLFSIAMLDHYEAMIDRCHARGITPVVTFSHCSVPRWFAEKGSWTSPDSPDLFARFCGHAARRLAQGVAYALTLNEPANGATLNDNYPPFLALIRMANAAAGKACNAPGFRMAVLPDPEEVQIVQTHLLAAHKAGKSAMKAARGDLPVGFSLALEDDEAVGPNSVRDAKRALYYGAWLEAAKNDDFLGVQNYDRVRWDYKGAIVTPPEDARLNVLKREVHPKSLANAVRYAHAATGVPILVTEHGMVTDQDSERVSYIPAALAELQKVFAEGVPLKGYIHWTLMDDFEWFQAYSLKYGLCSVDRTTFKRIPKPSAAVLKAIVQRNAI